MKHLKKGRKFGREKKQREALMKILMGELFLRGKIKTTEAKAKELKAMAEKACGKIKEFLAEGKKDKPEALAVLRQMRAIFPKNVEPKLLFEIAQSLPRVKSGFVRIIKTGSRRSDSAKMALIEIIKKEIVKKQ
ncbi:MAG: bL17 family ribosomal protein [Candidatus Moranbacteria bacterium]|nr:bL17 family ribosomal protein [Candidatus Moranbacteria bacterium]